MSRNLLLAALVAAAMALGNFLSCDDAATVAERSYFQALAALVTAFVVYRPSRRVPSVRETLAKHGMLSKITPSGDEIGRADCGPGVAADEDGCCANCGADCEIVPATPAHARDEAELAADAATPTEGP